MVSEEQFDKHLARPFDPVGLCGHFHAGFDLTNARGLRDSCSLYIDRADATDSNRRQAGIMTEHGNLNPKLSSRFPNGRAFGNGHCLAVNGEGQRCVFSCMHGGHGYRPVVRKRSVSHSPFGLNMLALYNKCNSLNFSSATTPCSLHPRA